MVSNNNLLIVIIIIDLLILFIWFIVVNFFLIRKCFLLFGSNLNLDSFFFGSWFKDGLIVSFNGGVVSLSRNKVGRKLESESGVPETRKIG